LAPNPQNINSLLRSSLYKSVRQSLLLSLSEIHDNAKHYQNRYHYHYEEQAYASNDLQIEFIIHCQILVISCTFDWRCWGTGPFWGRDLVPEFSGILDIDFWVEHGGGSLFGM
jgi:hypothetical protein